MTGRTWAYAGAARRDVDPWALIVAFVAFSAWGNSLHAPAGGATLRLVAATPPLAAALSWHLLVLPSFGESAWRRRLARLVAAGVFGYTMWGSWSSLTVLGLRAALPHPTVLPVAVDGLVFVAAVAVWSRAAGAASVLPVAPTLADEPLVEAAEPLRDDSGEKTGTAPTTGAQPVPIGTAEEIVWRSHSGPRIGTGSGPDRDLPGDQDETPDGTETGTDGETEFGTEMETESETRGGPNLRLVDRRRRRDGRVYCDVHRRYEPRSTEYKHRTEQQRAEGGA
jgi:hypothetical protein